MKPVFDFKDLIPSLCASVREFLLRHAVSEPRFFDPDLGLITGRAAIAERLGKEFFGHGFAKLEFLPLAGTETHAWYRFRTPDGTREGIFEFAFDRDRKLAEIKLFVTPQVEATWQTAATPHVALPPGLTIIALNDTKIVDKPWGHEHWLLHEGAPFACKTLFVKAGSRTSLQFHRHKEEASLLVSGRIRLHYAAREGADVQTIDIGPGTLWHVKPGTVHRMEAVSDALFLEVSTLELDDVIRLQDDTQRASGEVASEQRPRKKRVK